jgi:protocatechuate 3,4-dioxygenase beta subunit
MSKRPNNRALLARRHALAALSLAPLAPQVARSQARELAVTPAQTLGPFYPRSAAERPAQIDADLLTVQGERVLTKGTPLYLTGRVLTRHGRPVAGALGKV